MPLTALHRSRPPPRSRSLAFGGIVLDSARFDQLAKTLSTAATRRELLSRLSALLLAGPLVALWGEGNAHGAGSGAIIGGGGGRRRRRKRQHDPGGDKANRKGKHKRKGKGKGRCDPPCHPTCQTCNTGTGLCEDVTDGTACSDGNPCTVGETCQAGACTGGTAVSCTSPSECQDLPGACNPTSGQCTYANKAAGTPCTAVVCGSCDGAGACVGCTSAQDCLPNGTCATPCTGPADCVGCLFCTAAINGQTYCRGDATCFDCCSIINVCDRGQFCRSGGSCVNACNP